MAVYFLTVNSSAYYTIGRPGEDLGIATQVIEDWQTQPFVELFVVEDQCPDGTEPAFSYVWSGTQEGCVFPDVGVVPGKRV